MESCQKRDPKSRRVSHPFPHPSKIILQPACRLKKALIGECMIVWYGDPRAIRGRDLERRYGQIRFSYSGCYVGCGSAFIAHACNSGEWSNRRWRSGRTHRRGVARRRPGASCSSTAGLLRARAGLRRRTSLPIGSRALLGWVWLANSTSPDLQLIAHSPRTSLDELKSRQPQSGTWQPRGQRPLRNFTHRRLRPPLIGQFYPQNYPIIAEPRSATGSMSASGWEIFTTSNAFAHPPIADIPRRPAILRNGSADKHFPFHGRVLRRAGYPPPCWRLGFCRSRKSLGRRRCSRHRQLSEQFSRCGFGGRTRQMRSNIRMRMAIAIHRDENNDLVARCLVVFQDQLQGLPRPAIFPSHANGVFMMLWIISASSQLSSFLRRSCCDRPCHRPFLTPVRLSSLRRLTRLLRQG